MGSVGRPADVKAQAATMLYHDDTKPFFISASVGYQQRAQNQRGNSDFRNFFTGLTLHELTHTRQLPQAMRQIDTLRAKYKFPSSLDDNLIEATFASNSEFRKMVDEEKRQFARAVMASDAAAVAAEAAEGLRKMENRRKRFFVGEFEGWCEMEDVFLGLEGLAMWVQLQSSLKLAPAGTPWLNTLDLLSKRTDALSQSEGLGFSSPSTDCAKGGSQSSLDQKSLPLLVFFGIRLLIVRPPELVLNRLALVTTRAELPRCDYNN